MQLETLGILTAFLFFAVSLNLLLSNLAGKRITREKFRRPALWIGGSTMTDQKEMIISELQKNGKRITDQRRILLDVILEGKWSSCKEIYYKAADKDHKIGLATVYRMVNALEEIGAIDGKICTKWNVQKILQMKRDARLFWRTVLCSGCQKKSWIRLSGMESENVVILARERKYQRLFIIVRRCRKERAA